MICQSILTYGCESVSLTNQNIKDIDTLQGNLVKTIVGIGKTYRTTPILDALKLKKISNIIYNQSLNLMRNIFSFNSAARNLNLYFISNDINICGTLYNRVKNISNSYDINFYDCIFNDVNYKNKFHVFPREGENGLVDSLRPLLYANYVDREMIKLLLRSF